ncbi:GmrSD restriction endonuclease domain-containing protein [Actinomadura geliboluensis]|uniref:GmrSD restriction endonuclease domain-containing protein n=1 Tax=Actinomadura geliboluensis TaxID=882440 RepID=UPI0037232091
MADRKITAKDPKPTAERIEQLAQRVLVGDVILPEFQRPFVWKKKQILELVDSIYRNYPIGSMLVWESRQKLASKRSIADLEIADRSENYPVNYLLDGQQRLSTICGVLHWRPGDPKSVWNVYFDLKTQKFHHADTEDEFLVHQIPLRRLTDPADYFRRISSLDDPNLRETADMLFNRFKDYHVPLVTLEDMSINDVAPVFERINSTGTRLTIYDLMRAATWSPQFDLGKTIESIRSSLEAKKFHEFDNKTLLRALAAASGGDFSSASIDALREMSHEDLSQAADITKMSAQRAADFLATEIGAPRAEALPYKNQFAFLCELFRVLPHCNGEQLQEVKRWFWFTTLSSYFSGWDSGQMATDTRMLRQYALGKRSKLSVTAAVATARLWEIKPFRSNSAASKMLALMLAARTPLDLVNGQKIDVGKSLSWSNDKEYHHFFPQAYLARMGVGASKANVVGNIVLLTSKSNIDIRDSAPSRYLREIIDKDGRAALLKRAESNLVPETAVDAALADDYVTFLRLRSQHVHSEAQKLAGIAEDPANSTDDLDDSDEDPTE